MNITSPEQMELLSVDRELPLRSGAARVEARPGARILNRATGFVSAYDYTLNPYSGCQFGCAYCYAAFFVPNVELFEQWGRWVHVKTQAVAEIRRCRTLAGRKVYMSTVTDPYQPLEATVRLTRELLEEMSATHRQPRLVIQTRSPLVTRDIDLFKRFTHLRVNVTVTTDSDVIRKRFEPACPSIEQRLRALAELKAAGLNTGVCLTPLLPLEDPEGFARQLAELHADVYVAQPFHASHGKFAAGTQQTALEMARDFDWTIEKYRAAFKIIANRIPMLLEGRAGFYPV